MFTTCTIQSLIEEGDAPCKAMQGIANDRPEIAQRVFKNREKSIGATGFEPAT